MWYLQISLNSATRLDDGGNAFFAVMKYDASIQIKQRQTDINHLVFIQLILITYVSPFFFRPFTWITTTMTTINKNHQNTLQFFQPISYTLTSPEKINNLPMNEGSTA